MPVPEDVVVVEVNEPLEDAAGCCAREPSSSSVSVTCSDMEVPKGARFFLVTLLRALHVLNFPLGGAVLVDNISASYIIPNDQTGIWKRFKSTYLHVGYLYIRVV